MIQSTLSLLSQQDYVLSCCHLLHVTSAVLSVPHPVIFRQQAGFSVTALPPRGRLAKCKLRKKNRKSQTMQLIIPAPRRNGTVPHANSAHRLANVHRHQFTPVSEEDPVSVGGGERKAPAAARGYRVQRLLPALLPSHVPPELAQEG